MFMVMAQNRSLLCNEGIFLLQVIVNYNILQFLKYPYVLQIIDTVDYTWWVIFKQHKEMKSK